MNKVKFGLKNVHYAKQLVAEDGKISYAVPVAMPGAVNLSLEAQGEETPFYADNIKFFNMFANNGYTGDLETARIIDQFLKDILGQTVDKNGAIIESTEDKASNFALMFEVDGDANARRTVLYNCSASRPKTEASTTTESIEPKTDTISITASPRAADGVVKAVIEPSEENRAIYDTFYNTVYEPDADVEI